MISIHHHRKSHRSVASSRRDKLRNLRDDKFTNLPRSITNVAHQLTLKPRAGTVFAWQRQSRSCVSVHTFENQPGQNRKNKNNEEFSNLCKKESELINKATIMLKQKDLKGLGKCMHDNQEFLEKIGISNQKLQEMIKIAENSSFGAKITGAGGGGCIIALTDESNLEKSMYELKKNSLDCFSVKIDLKGLDTF